METQRCRDPIDQTIREHFDGWHLDHDIHLPIIEEFGIERVNTVIASTLAHKDYDGRFSRYNREWASGLNVTTDDRYVSEAHPAVLDGFIDMVRKYNEQGITETAGEGTDEAPADIPDEDSEGIKRITTYDLRYKKGASVSELVSSSKQDSQGRGDLFLSFCIHPKPLPWACALPTSLLWSRPKTETHHNEDWHHDQISPEAVVLAMEAKTFFYKPSDLSGFNSLLESAFPGILFSAITSVKGCSP